MIFRKSNSPHRYYETIEKLNNIIFCEDCGVAIKEGYAQEVIYKLDPMYKYGGSGYSYINNLYYCKLCKKGYDIIVKDDFGSGQTGHKIKDKYYKNNVEVNEKGTIIV